MYKLNMLEKTSNPSLKRNTTHVSISICIHCSLIEISIQLVARVMMGSSFLVLLLLLLLLLLLPVRDLSSGRKQVVGPDRARI